jgi:GT2 family glycosyltransferase
MSSNVRSNPVDISIIIVSWNVRELLRRCLWSVVDSQQPDGNLITDHRPRSTEIIVVDNASADGTVEMVRAEFPNVRLIANAENAGFTRANNQALAIAQGRYLFLLNPDTELRAGALQILYDYAEAHPRAGIIGPQLFYGDGTLQSSRRRFPTLATAFLESTILQQWFPHNRVLTRYYMLDTRDDSTQPVDWINGSAMFVRRDVYEQIGGLDEGFFMYSEELDWCYRAKRAGWDIVYLPSAQITHYEGKSSEQVVAQRDIYFNASKVRFVRKYRGAFSAEILRAFLLFTFVYRIVEESVKGLLGHKRTLRAQRVKAYWQVLQSGLRYAAVK